MGERDEAEQLQLPLEVWEPVPAPRQSAALREETEGNQDTEHWGA